ncbi:MAG: hypothetical protein D3924_07290 [Candidatus Electrothrix sp. AR4]|nr:hypothetical protein [Candidatus Electrothrix sp. AR4]
MSYYYLVRSTSEEGFEGLRFVDNGHQSRIRKVSDEDIEAVERLLDVRYGTLNDDVYFLESKSCKCECGRRMTMYDFVFTSLIDAEYSKAFVLHMLLDAKYAVQNTQPVRCALCGVSGKHKSDYKISHYDEYLEAALA